MGKYDEYLISLSKIHDGALTPEIVVNAAKDQKSPIHNYFQWNNDKAAVSYRLWQARQLIASVDIQITEERKVRKFINVIVKDEPLYLERKKITAQYGDQIRQNALTDLGTFVKRYYGFESVSDLVTIIEKLL